MLGLGSPTGTFAPERSPSEGASRLARSEYGGEEAAWLECEASRATSAPSERAGCPGWLERLSTAARSMAGVFL